MPAILGIPKALHARGLTVEVVPGWETRGSTNWAPVGSVSHWTAGPRTGDRPSLNICVNGKTGVPGPLCNVFLTRSGVAIVVSGCRANHAGLGGIGGLVGNSSAYGTEAESSGTGDWTPAQRWAYPRINAAFIDLGARREHIYGHSEWAPTRKIDIRDWPMSLMRSQVHALLAGEDDMPSDDVIKRLAAEAVKETIGGDIVELRRMMGVMLAWRQPAPGTPERSVPQQMAPGMDALTTAVSSGSADVRTQLGEQSATIVAAIMAAIAAAGGSIEHAVIDQAVRDAVSSLTIVLPEPDEP